MAQYTLPYISTPFFMTQDLDDSWQMANIFQLPCSPWESGSCNATELANMVTYRSDVLTALAPLLNSPTNGGFLSTCVQHCHQNIQPCWLDSIIQGQNLQ